MVSGVSRDWVVWYSVLGCFSGPVFSGVSRDWVVWYGVLGILQWTGGCRCFKVQGGIVFRGCFCGRVVTGVSRDWVVWCFRDT